MISPRIAHTGRGRGKHGASTGLRIHREVGLRTVPGPLSRSGRTALHRTDDICDQDRGQGVAVGEARRGRPQGVDATGGRADCRGHLRRLHRRVAGPAGPQAQKPRALPQAARPAPVARVRSHRAGVHHVGVGALLACRYRDQDTDAAGALLWPAPNHPGHGRQ